MARHKQAHLTSSCISTRQRTYTRSLRHNIRVQRLSVTNSHVLRLCFRYNNQRRPRLLINAMTRYLDNLGSSVKLVRPSRFHWNFSQCSISIPFTRDASQAKAASETTLTCHTASTIGIDSQVSVATPLRSVLLILQEYLPSFRRTQPTISPRKP